MFLPTPVPKPSLAVLNWRRHIPTSWETQNRFGENAHACVLSVWDTVKLEELVYCFTVRCYQESVITSFREGEDIGGNQKLMLYAKNQGSFSLCAIKHGTQETLGLFDFLWFIRCCGACGRGSQRPSLTMAMSTNMTSPCLWESCMILWLTPGLGWATMPKTWWAMATWVSVDAGKGGNCAFVLWVLLCNFLVVLKIVFRVVRGID